MVFILELGKYPEESHLRNAQPSELDQPHRGSEQHDQVDQARDHNAVNGTRTISATTRMNRILPIQGAATILITEASTSRAKAAKHNELWDFWSRTASGLA